jgi:archaellin
MNNTLAPAEPAPIDSGPSTLETIIALLTLILTLAAVVVSIAQYLQSRASKSQQSDTESGVEMLGVRSHRSDTDAHSVASLQR